MASHCVQILTWNIGRLAADKSPILNGTVSLTAGMDKPDTPPYALVYFKENAYAVSGIKVDSLVVHNETYSLYKGVRCITTAGNFQIRM